MHPFFRANVRPPLVLAQRAYSIEAVKLALAAGADGASLDVYVTKDKQCVVCPKPEIQGMVVADVNLQDIPAKHAPAKLADMLLAVPEAAFKITLHASTPNFQTMYVCCLCIPGGLMCS